MLEFFLALLVIFFLFQALFGPVLVKFTQWVRTDPEISAVPPDELPPSCLEKISVYRKELEALGFVFTGYYDIADLMPNVRVSFALLRNTKRKTWAMVPVLKSKPLEDCYVEFSTEFSDGEELCTNNSSQLSAFIKTPGKKIFQFPKVGDPGTLIELHDCLQDAHFRNKRVVMVGEDNALRYLKANITRDFIQQAELGFYYLDKDGEKFRLSWKGAVLMTWMLIFPINIIRKIWLHVTSKKMMTEMGFSLIP